MAEAEELVSDAARHATIYARRLWLRYRPPPDAPPTALLVDIAPRLDLLITALTGRSLPIRIAQLPARPTLLSRLYRRHQAPWLRQPIPATDGQRLWLPADSGIENIAQGNELYRVMALQQAARIQRSSAELLDPAWPALLADAYLLLEAWAADAELIAHLPGMIATVTRLRQYALQARPPLSTFSRPRQSLEALLRQLLEAPCGQPCAAIPLSPSPKASVRLAPELLASIGLSPTDRAGGNAPLLKDWWTGELRQPASSARNELAPGDAPTEPQPTAAPTRSSHLLRRPDVREAKEDEDDDSDAGVFMVQADEPHQHAEDPFGLNRPVDKDEDISADDYGDMLSELSEARLVSTPGRSKEVLISDDPPDTNTAMQLKTAIREQQGLRYPEWDYRIQAYHQPGATLHVLPNLPGSQQWVDDTLDAHRSLLNHIRRRFEMLSAQRVTRRKQLDGDDIDLQAYIDSYADFRAGGSLSAALYQTRRTAERNLAITLLIDISGSTDSWVSTNRRIIDVEREALLLVSVALDGMGEPWSIQAFSGEGPDAVIVRQIKGFDENFSNEVALRISSLEPEHYTRAGTAIRHASRDLLQQPASHRLLLVLSDGKPNDKDIYEGQYGVEDMRQAVTEATLQGISAFCLTIDRQAPAYLPRIFGAQHYALLPRPELLPTVLLDWMKRLVVH
ncbi:nitric oxide reductase activation protein NorD [Halopseudomonas bauzanensis]|uniref:Nitric oxide reductase NorD protein n=1 Tax=Halopseudomonas bauzanensis TaxID=653930 RepID=A0A1H9SKZ5_9GAMM|nr:VWA domain-containing protein [Halopseudomonas bauzanensis]SER85631.1 nitric oxide reductase NorD protein [Halopseudomonas bauzanensis]SFL94771.1 nitric oxide reductase NorD protein [Halopseudomonas bauzanensis]